MLRSLVGSEMCIRDRYLTLDLNGPNKNCIASYPMVVNYLLGNETLILPCLLYTSDAADDLLCVDLGGRRIIKKKLINITSRTSIHITK